MMNQNYRRRLSWFVNVALVITVFEFSDIRFWTSSGAVFANIRRSLASNVTPPTSVKTANITKSGPCIVFFVTNKQKDVNDLKLALNSLAMLKDNQKVIPAPVLVFNEGNLDPTQKAAIVDSTLRSIRFPEVNLGGFNIQFDPDSNINVKKWRGYQEMRFWVSGIWKHSALEQYSTVMKMSTDSCFSLENDENLPHFESGQLVYHSPYDGYAKGEDVLGMVDFTEDYMNKNNITAQNPMLWRFAKSAWSSKKRVPTFNTNFEIIRKAWMQQPAVVKWQDAVVEQAPGIIFRHRWRDSAIRYLTVALFSANYRVHTVPPFGYAEDRRCSERSVKDGLIAMYD